MKKLIVTLGAVGMLMLVVSIAVAQPPDRKGGRRGGPGGRGGPPPIGQILPSFLQERLNLTAAQKKELDKLQKDVDTKLAAILTDEQKQTLKEMQERGPGRGGPRDGGPGGPPPGGRPDGPPPAEQP